MRQQPYRSLGEVLKRLRASAFKTPAEVSSAVEIEESRLRAYENGEQRPSEDILLLLIQHFRVEGEQAAELWRLAGYGNSPETERDAMQDDFTGTPHITFGLMASDNKVVYTDMVKVAVNNYGVVMQFLQGSGSETPLAVAKVGMSKEHARSVVELLPRTLAQSDRPKTPKRLESGSAAAKKSSPSKDQQ